MTVGNGGLPSTSNAHRPPPTDKHVPHPTPTFLAQNGNEPPLIYFPIQSLRAKYLDSRLLASSEPTQGRKHGTTNPVGGWPLSLGNGVQHSLYIRMHGTKCAHGQARPFCDV